MSQIDRHSMTWKTIESWAMAEIEKGRDLLEQAADAEQRGRIRALRDLLGLVEPERKQSGGTVNYTG